MKFGSHLYSVNGNGMDGTIDFLPVREIVVPPPFISELDPDHLCSLVLEVIPQGSCLVFCPTKSNCQNVALLLSKCLYKYR